MTPQWMTAERLAKLGELCERDDHLCLKGHARCPEKSHYQWATSHQEAVAVPKAYYVHDKSLNMDFLACSMNVTEPGQVTVWEWESAYLHEAVVEETIASWKADDREQRALDWKREQQAILDGTYGKFGRLMTVRNGRASHLDPVSRDAFMAQRPEFYLKATGVDGTHFRPVAVVRVPSTDICLYVDVSAAFVQPTKPTKSQRKNARRRGKPIQEVAVTPVTVEQLCQQAVALWWNKRS